MHLFDLPDDEYRGAAQSYLGGIADNVDHLPGGGTSAKAMRRAFAKRYARRHPEAFKAAYLKALAHRRLPEQRELPEWLEEILRSQPECA